MNRISSILNFIANKLGNVTMGTTATTITGAIAEHESEISTLQSNVSVATVLLSNCNAATDPRKIYVTNGDTTNKPSTGGSYFYVRCFASSGNYCCQIAMNMNATSATFYIRSKTASEWGAWKALS